MLIHQGKERTQLADRRLACFLAAIAGGLNTAAFHAVGFFSANMTGNVSILSDHLSRNEWMDGMFYLLILIAFVAGAAASALLIGAGKHYRIRATHAWAILAESILLILLGIAIFCMTESQRGPMMILGLAFLMGLQNAVVTHISDARVRTTHISGMATDFGIELGALIGFATESAPRIEKSANALKLRLHSQTLLFFLIGGIFGVWIAQAIGYRILFVAGAILLLVSAVAIGRSRASSSQENTHR